MSAPLVLVPGLNNTRAVFAGVVDALPSDLTAFCANNPVLPSVEAIANEWLAWLPERFWLGGFSFGGYVALAMLELAPERVIGLALLCTSPLADSPSTRSKRQAALDAVVQGRYLEWVQAQCANTFHPDSLLKPELMAARERMVIDYGAQAYTAHVQATMARPDRSHLLDGRHPTLVLAGADDKLFAPQTLERLARSVPGGEFTVVQAAGHMAPMEQPERVAKALADWIARHS